MIHLHEFILRNAVKPNVQFTRNEKKIQILQEIFGTYVQVTLPRGYSTHW